MILNPVVGLVVGLVGLVVGLEGVRKPLPASGYNLVTLGIFGVSFRDVSTSVCLATLNHLS